MTDILQQLRDANIERGFDPQSDKLSYWGNAIAGEVGELCNVIKKIERGDGVDKRDGQPLNVNLGKEAADIIIYLDIITRRQGLDLRAELVKKYNEVADERGFPQKLIYYGENI